MSRWKKLVAISSLALTLASVAYTPHSYGVATLLAGGPIAWAIIGGGIALLGVGTVSAGGFPAVVVSVIGLVLLPDGQSTPGRFEEVSQNTAHELGLSAVEHETYSNALRRYNAIIEFSSLEVGQVLKNIADEKGGLVSDQDVQVVGRLAWTNAVLDGAISQEEFEVLMKFQAGVRARVSAPKTSQANQ
jgi:hypothetical protein